jgi:hypothetical protein
MDEKLKACPFCGNQPELVGRGGYWWVVCVCGMETKKLNTPTSEEALDVQVCRWNRRTSVGIVCLCSECGSDRPNLDPCPRCSAA